MAAVVTALFDAAAERARIANQPHLAAALAHLAMAVAEINDAQRAIDDARKGGARSLYYAERDLLQAIDTIGRASAMLRRPGQ